MKIGYVTTTTTSLVTVPGDAPAFYDVQDVPHGEIRTLLYKSRSNGTTRELTVYVPPGYDEARNRRYPVLYLLHGFANDHHSWHRYGRANDILDNLLAQETIEPFLVVMPLGYGGAQVNGDGTGIPPEDAGRASAATRPLRARSPRGHHPDDRQQVPDGRRPQAPGDCRLLDGRRAGRPLRPAPSGDVQPGRDHERRHGRRRRTPPLAALAANPAKANKQIDLLWIACGKDDTAMKGAQTLHDALEQAGIEHTFLETEGAHHWRVWRRYLRDLAPLLFK